MLMCRVEGSAISTLRHPSLKGWRLLICQPVNDASEKDGLPILCLDHLGAAEGQWVVATSDGKSVREKVGDPHSPARYMIMAILDEGPSGAGEEAVA